MTTFWDTSALIPLLVIEKASDDARSAVEDDDALVVWWGSPVECLSAIARRERAGALSPTGADEARRVLVALSANWSEVEPTDPLRDHAGALLRRHALTAGDALQLAAAIIWSEGRPTHHRFVSLDRRLAQTARSEGFDVVMGLDAEQS